MDADYFLTIANQTMWVLALAAVGSAACRERV